ncbi:MAG: anaerobic sulfatase maturase [Planctomycetota bacterium]|nr:anaerobic sulfatase maturase [Planctomycetota bacterium]
MSRVVQPFHIMTKPVSGTCNLDCGYCYYTMKPRELYPDTKKFLMAEEVLGDFVRQYLAAMPLKCEFGWQGGEPLLAGKEFFRKAVAFQKQFGAAGQVVTNGLQTNGTLLDEEWCDFFCANKFLVGISLDGPAQVHDANRRDKAGQPTWHRAWAGLELLSRKGVEFNVLVTLNSANAPHAGNIYRYFVNRGIQYLQFIHILERKPGTDDPTDFSCRPEQLGRWMLDVFEQWAARDVGRVSVRFIDDALHGLIYGRASTCVHSQRCAAAYVLEWNGDLYACDHFVYKEWKIGNLRETPLVDLVTSPRVEEFATLKTDLPPACRDCEFLSMCWGGCPKHHRPIGRDPARTNHFCEGYKMFFKRALPELRRIAEYIKRGELPPTAGAAAAQKVQAAGGAARPGRNDPCPCGSGRKFKACCGRM